MEDAGRATEGKVDVAKIPRKMTDTASSVPAMKVAVERKLQENFMSDTASGC